MQHNGLNRIVTMAIIGCLALCPAGELSASRVSAEDSRIHGLMVAFNFYRMDHQGALPKNWNDLARYFDFDSVNRPLAVANLPPTQELYQFITQDLPYTYESDDAFIEGSRVILIRTVPVPERGSNRIRRRLLYQTANGTVGNGSVLESRFQEMLRRANLSLGAKPGDPLVQSSGIATNRNSHSSQVPTLASQAKEPDLLTSQEFAETLWQLADTNSQQVRHRSSHSRSHWYWVIAAAAMLLIAMFYTRRRLRK